MGKIFGVEVQSTSNLHARVKLRSMHSTSVIISRHLWRTALVTLAIDEFAQQSAWQLGHNDYPAVDRCIYACGKNPVLYGAYWSGWNNAAAAQWGIYAPRRANRSNRNRFSKHRPRRAA